MVGTKSNKKVERLMELALVLMILLTMFSIAIAGVSLYIAYRATTAFLATEYRKEQMLLFMKSAILSIQDSSQIFRTELVRRMSMDIPEVRDLNGLLQRLEVNMSSFKNTLQQFIVEEGE